MYEFEKPESGAPNRRAECEVCDRKTVVETGASGDGKALELTDMRKVSAPRWRGGIVMVESRGLGMRGIRP